MAQNRSRQAPTQRAQAPAWNLGGLDPIGEDLRLESIGADLQKRAAQMLGDPSAPDALGASALVRAGCLRHLPKDVPWKKRAHLLAFAANATRRLFADRERNSLAPAPALGQTPAQTPRGPKMPDLAQIDRALTQLASLDATMALAIELRLYAVCDAQEAARYVGLSAAKFRRRWKTALAQLEQLL